MYLRQSNKWKDFLLAEAIENIGLPSRVVRFIRRKAQATAHSDAHAQKLADQQNVELQKIDEKHLTWLGQLLKKFDMKLFNVTDARNLAQFIKKAVRETSGVDASSSEEEREAQGERIVDAVGPIIEWAMGIKSDYDEARQTLADILALRKRMTRALKRVGLPEGEIKTAQGIFDRSVISNFENSDDLQLRLRRIMIVLTLDPPYYEEELKSADSLRMAYRLAQEFLANPKKDPDKVIHTFDNGYFWYDIQSHACDFEAKEMAHCGRGEYGTLYSLRSGEKRKMKPFVTIEFDGSTIYQIKGKANDPPKEDLWPYIHWFIENSAVAKIVETEGSEMLDYLQEKHPGVQFGDEPSTWAVEADALLDAFEGEVEGDSHTDVELDLAADGDDEEVGVTLVHNAFWPLLDKVAEEDPQSDRLEWDIKLDAQTIADETLYPNPHVSAATIFPRGVQDSRAAMLRIKMIWSRSFEPEDLENEESVMSAVDKLNSFLDEMKDIAEQLMSHTYDPDEEEFNYNGFWEGVERRLKEYGVYRDIAGEIDAADARDRSSQMELPLGESRIFQRWQQIIK